MHVRVSIVTLLVCLYPSACVEPKAGDDHLERDVNAGARDAAAPPEEASWRQLEGDTKALLTSVQFLDENEGWIAGFDATLQHTLDGGEHWEVVPPLGIDRNSGFSALHFLNDQTGWAAGHGIVVRTLDGGESWRGFDNTGRVAPGTPSYNSVFAISRTATWTVGAIQNHKEVPSCESGSTSCPTLWHELLPLMAGLPRDTQEHLIDRMNVLNDVYFADPTIGYAVGSSGFILKILDAAASGTAIKLETQVTATDVDLNAVFMLDDQTVWVVGDEGTILHTSNGEDWSDQPSGVSVVLHDIYFVDAQHGWAAGDEGTILVTTDGGEEWTAMTTDVSVALNALSFPTPQLGVAVGEDGTILKWSER